MKVLEQSRPAVSILDFSTAEIVQYLQDRLSRFQISAAYLFGSCVAGTPSAWSDIDIVVVMETDRPFLERPRIFADHIDLGIPVDILVYTPDEFNTLSNSAAGFWKSFRENHRRIV